jgi:creatinine amidohydrolase
LKPTHASWLEVFPFTRVAELPPGEKIPPAVPGLMGAEESRRVYGDGVFGGPYQVDRAIMDELFAAA